LAFGLAGLLLKAKWAEDKVSHFIRAVAEHAGDDETEKRVLAVARTQKTIEDGGIAAGFTTLCEIWGKELTEKIASFLSATPEEAVPQGAILVTNAASKTLAKVAWGAIVEGEKEGDPTLFSFGESIARIEDRKIQPLTKDGFWQELADRTNWVRKVGKKMLHCDPPPNTVTYMRHQQKKEVPLPVILGATSTPIMSESGKVQTEPGYHPESKIYLFPDLEVPKVRETPLEEEVKRAKEFVEEVIVDFPFVHESDRAHAIGMMLLPFVRPMIRGSTPLHLLDKPMQGTGATLLAEAATAIKTGGAIAAQSAPRNEEEWQKVILSKLMSAPEFLFLDNVKTIYSDSLAIALTASEYEGRRLGVSEMVRVPIRCVWIMTGNNVEMSGDFPRRICQIRLDANIEDPTTRKKFLHPDLHGWISKNRGWLVWSMLTMARAWISSGRPEPPRTLASYADWARVIGGILEHSGISGFLETPDHRKRTVDPLIDRTI
jgi:hypothetical protein